ncbi:glycine tRNA synthetase, beta subunit (Glycine--tRNA ligase beta chain) (GlyRS) [Herminiimonas arsenicoxydans]|uniref:Glycine--tRNA ligase beta subunit n=1 Tax=Herminiimonas arsenicoxydans TaxID=204773 RepID=A4G261_HERAR|nr:glycine tRNA synthetase, beta subunit (Glycine--tRNA ligase beta chain) (GlyRS) [Herminiimonas arsenicoxydans]
MSNSVTIGMDTKNLLIELFVEELPPKALKKIGDAFAQLLQASLKTQGLLSTDSVLTQFASPRRLGVHLTQVAEQADDKQVMQKLMPASVGLTADGKATPALLKKLSALGANESAVAGLKRESDGKAEVLFFNSIVTGVTLADGLQKALEETLAKLPIPKVMGYQLADGWETVNFVRPAHGLVALHGADVINVSALGLTAGNTTRGHRFEAGLDPVYIRDADSYAKQIATEGAVIASFAERRAEIVRQLAAAASEAGDNLTPIEDEDLLDEVTGLVERPNVLIGQFEETFLAVPQECLILTMKANQKYFPLLDSKGNLSNKFLIVSNIRPADASLVIGGNERVVRPRLADAKFFFDQDRKKTLASRVAGLDKVVYHNKLGTQGERIARVRAIAQAIAAKLGIDVQQADTAAQLAKADLLTDMVGEFPELQGIMGRYYALHDGLAENVADAIEDHYKPRFAGDTLPRNPVGMVVALADKLETLVGLFSIGQIPTGDKDPFALRRHALGVIRMLIEGKLDIGINELIAAAEQPFNKLAIEHRDALITFIFDRLANALREQGYSAQEIDAVLALQPQKLADVASRLAAVRAFAVLPEAPALAAANKRVGNILKKVEGEVTAKVDPALLKEAAEIALNQTLTTVKPQADTAFARGDYAASLQVLAALKTPVDAFFESVMVNADDAALRNNRLGLLATLHHAMNQVADISKLAA